MHFDTKKLTRCALIAAIYVALTMLSNALNLAYGPIQLRFSEAMTVLPFLMPGELGPLYRLRALEHPEPLRPARHDRRLGGHAARSAPHRPLPQ